MPALVRDSAGIYPNLTTRRIVSMLEKVEVGKYAFLDLDDYTSAYNLIHRAHNYLSKRTCSSLWDRRFHIKKITGTNSIIVSRSK